MSSTRRHLSARASLKLEAPRAQVWAALADFQNVALFHPMLASAEPVGEVARGLGAARQCNFHDGHCAIERVVDWQEGHSLRIAFEGGTLPLLRIMRQGTVTLSVEPLGTAESVVQARMDFEMKGGLLGRLFGRLLLVPISARMFTQVLCGLAHYVRTGERITDRVPQGARKHCQLNTA